MTNLFESFTLRSEMAVGTNQTHKLNSSSIVGQITSTNGSFINATLTIMRPINLNGSTITCNRDTLTLNIPTRSGKFFCHQHRNWEGTGMICSPKMLMYTSVSYLKINTT